MPVPSQGLDSQRYMSRYFFCVGWVKLRGDCTFCWHWWDCLSFLFIMILNVKLTSSWILLTYCSCDVKQQSTTYSRNIHNFGRFYWIRVFNGAFNNIELHYGGYCYCWRKLEYLERTLISRIPLTSFFYVILDRVQLAMCGKNQYISWKLFLCVLSFNISLNWPHVGI